MAGRRRVGILIAGVRAAERALPVWLLYALVWPPAAARTAWELRFGFGGIVTTLPRSMWTGANWRWRTWRSRVPLNAVWSTVDGHTLRLSAAVCQLAAMCQAVIVPYLLTAAPSFRVTMHFGEPVPDALVFDYRCHQAACDHLHREFLPVVRTFPEQCYPVLANALREPADQR